MNGSRQPVPLPVIEQQLERRARTVAEHVDGADEGVVAEHLPTHGGEPIDPFAKIHRFRGDKDAALRGELQHERPSTKARTSASSAGGDMGVCMQSRVPSARDSSIWVTTAGGGPGGADGTSTKPRDRGDPTGVPSHRVAIRFLRSIKRTRNCLATREGGKVAAKVTACSQSSWGMRSEGCVRVWRQCANCAANWSSWWSPCNGVVLIIRASQSSGSCHMDDCRPAKIKFHARWSVADAWVVWPDGLPASCVVLPGLLAE